MKDLFSNITVIAAKILNGSNSIVPFYNIQINICICLPFYYDLVNGTWRVYPLSFALKNIQINRISKFCFKAKLGGKGKFVFALGIHSCSSILLIFLHYEFTNQFHLFFFFW